jgi:hypothetical protein
LLNEDINKHKNIGGAKVVFVNVKEEETRTSATVLTQDLKIFRTLARLKFDKDPMNNAWKEAVKLFNEENKHLLTEFTS